MTVQKKSTLKISLLLFEPVVKSLINTIFSEVLFEQLLISFTGT